jgi:opacity protein-like surface antigen
MKKLLCALAMLYMASSSFAQALSFGLKAGGNLSFSKIDIEQISINGDVAPGFYGGAFLQFSPGYEESDFRIQVEALYNRAVAQYSDEDESESGKVKMKINQIVVPLLAQYFFIPQFSVNVGPTFNLNLGGKASIESSDESASYKLTSDDLNSFQIGLAAGVSYYFDSGLLIEARYNPVFGQFNKKTDGDLGTKMRISNVQLGIGYQFGS